MLTLIARGCSGAWVLQGDTLCGYLISARNESLWAYMMPIQSVVEDVIQTLGVRSVRLPNVIDRSLQAGNLSDIVPASQSDSPRIVAPGLLAQVAGATTREVAGRMTPSLTGIERAGLALAIFPVVVEMADWYSGKITGRDSKLLAESLRNNEQMFLNSLESLLRSAMPAAELQGLLSDVTGDAWRDQALNDRLVEYLGCEADTIMDSINDIYGTVSKLKEKLPVGTLLLSKDPG